MHTVLKQVDYDYQRMQYNTVVSGSHEDAQRAGRLQGSGVHAEGALARCAKVLVLLLRCLYPATPHLAHALWNELGLCRRCMWRPA